MLCPNLFPMLNILHNCSTSNCLSAYPIPLTLTHSSEVSMSICEMLLCSHDEVHSSIMLQISREESQKISKFNLNKCRRNLATGNQKYGEFWTKNGDFWRENFGNTVNNAQYFWKVTRWAPRHQISSRVPQHTPGHPNGCPHAKTHACVPEHEPGNKMPGFMPYACLGGKFPAHVPYRAPKQCLHVPKRAQATSLTDITFVKWHVNIEQKGERLGKRTIWKIKNKREESRIKSRLWRQAHWGD